MDNKLCMAVVAVIVLLFSFASLQVAFAAQPEAYDETRKHNIQLKLIIDTD